MGSLVMTEKIYPIEQSQEGDNTLTLPCEVFKGRRHYAVCLRIINKHESGEPHQWETNCNMAISCQVCPALEMRNQEEAAGHALFFEERDLEKHQKVKKNEIHSRSYQRGWSQLNAKPKASAPKVQSPPTEPMPVTKKSEPKKTSGSMHADLVNKLMKEEKLNDNKSDSPGTNN